MARNVSMSQVPISECFVCLLLLVFMFLCFNFLGLLFFLWWGGWGAGYCWFLV